MSSAVAATAPRPEAPDLPAPARSGRVAKWRRRAVQVWKYVVGAWLCQHLLLSVLVVGWCYRLMRHHTRREWLRLSGRTAPPLPWPNWLLHPDGFRAPSRRKALTASLVLNARVGAQAVFNTWVVTMPACFLWVFAWYSGWDNSFNKGYEQFWVGPAAGWLGITLFIAAMLYVPLAQARHAATGSWRAFYRFGFVRRLVRHAWPACLLLAGLYAALSLPVTVFRAFPTILPQVLPDLLTLPDAALREFLRDYYFWASAIGFGLYVALRLIAARIYARAIVSAVQRGVVRVDELHPRERRELDQLGLLEAAPAPERHVVVRVLGWTSARVARLGGAVAIVLLWFAFVAQIFVAEFINYHPVRGWLNQPLVQLPCFSYIPRHLRD